MTLPASLVKIRPALRFVGLWGTNALLDTLWPDIEVFVQYLQEAAKKETFQTASPDKATSQLLIKAASNLPRAVAMADEADKTLLGGHYDPELPPRCGVV